jgi:hypothetical protein
MRASDLPENPATLNRALETRSRAGIERLLTLTARTHGSLGEVETAVRSRQLRCGLETGDTWAGLGVHVLTIVTAVKGAAEWRCRCLIGP